MSKKHIVFLTDEEIKALVIHCRAGLKMAQDSNFFKQFESELKSALVQLEEKSREINEL